MSYYNILNSDDAMDIRRLPNISGIYLDLDGVLSDYVLGMQETIRTLRYGNIVPNELVLSALKDAGFEKYTDFSEFESTVSDIKAYHLYTTIAENYLPFWNNMPINQKGKTMWEKIEYLSPFIITSWDGSNELVRQGKLHFIKNNFLIDHDRVILTSNKSLYAVGKYNRPSILIDDTASKCAEWTKKGGMAYLWEDDLEDCLKWIGSIGLPYRSNYQLF